MSLIIDQESDAEPPSPAMAAATAAATTAATTADRVMAIAHLAPSAHVAVIGHHTLPFVLALLRSGCSAVRSLRPDAPSPDREPTDLTWIVDFKDDEELDEALRAARWRIGSHGRVVLEGACGSTLRAHALSAGLDIVSFDHIAHRLVLAPTPPPLAAAA
jgi:hypothetical protein